MCFSAEASLGSAVILLPAGVYCLEAAWRKDRRYLPLAAVPVMFGLQQLCEARVWVGLDSGNRERTAALGFLFFALAVWPIWAPLSAAAMEPPGRKRRILVALSGLGLMFAATHYLPLVSEWGRGLNPTVVGHSIRYDLSAVTAIHVGGWWMWMALYLLAVCGPLLLSRDRLVRPLGVAIFVAAVVSSASLEYAFASVWCFFAAVLSAYLAYVFYRLPAPPPRNPEPAVRFVYSN